MKRLILMRHAKSDWNHPGLTDHDRPLNKRGRAAAPAMGAWLTAQGFAPDLALVSSAERAQETFRLSTLTCPHQTESALYNANAGAILKVIQRADEAANTVIVIAHQPGMQEAANRLLPEWVVDEYPTAKAAILIFEARTWFEVTWGDGRLVAEMAPKLLTMPES